MFLQKDTLWIGIGIAGLTLWAILWHLVPRDFRLIYVSLLALIIIPLAYLLLARIRFARVSGVSIIMGLVIIFLGIVSFCHAVLAFDVLHAFAKLFK